MTTMSESALRQGGLWGQSSEDWATLQEPVVRPAFEVVAEPLLRVARRRVPDGDFQVGDISALPWDDASFDIAIGFNSFEYAVDPVAALQERGAPPHHPFSLSESTRREGNASSRLHSPRALRRAASPPRDIPQLGRR